MKKLLCKIIGHSFIPFNLEGKFFNRWRCTRCNKNVDSCVAFKNRIYFVDSSKFEQMVKEENDKIDKQTNYDKFLIIKQEGKSSLQISDIRKAEKCI